MPQRLSLLYIFHAVRLCSVLCCRESSGEKLLELSKDARHGFDISLSLLKLHFGIWSKGLNCRYVANFSRYAYGTWGIHSCAKWFLDVIDWGTEPKNRGMNNTVRKAQLLVTSIFQHNVSCQEQFKNSYCSAPHPSLMLLLQATEHASL